MKSKELLSEVLDPQCILTNEKEYPLSINENYITYYILGDVGQSIKKNINTNELVHKCKVKALEYGYEIVEEKNQVKIFDGNKRRARFIGDIKENYKLSRVFDSYEWILDNK